MQAQVNIEFDQLIRLAKNLPAKQWLKLKNEVEKEQAEHDTSDLVAFLLTGPVFSKKQLNSIAKTRKALNQWRTK
ncbi:MAG TPA: hypothetical protein VK808_09465 [Bacteroidia bacterium]|nr:hypothetical protein [Bacteroidia bacterium]